MKSRWVVSGIVRAVWLSAAKALAIASGSIGLLGDSVGSTLTVRRRTFTGNQAFGGNGGNGGPGGNSGWGGKAIGGWQWPLQLRKLGHCCVQRVYRQLIRWRQRRLR